MKNLTQPICSLSTGWGSGCWAKDSRPSGVFWRDRPIPTQIGLDSPICEATSTFPTLWIVCTE